MDNGYLVLSRKRDESILIDDNIEVRIVEVYGGTVRLAISAPKSVPIVRSEIKHVFKEQRESKERQLPFRNAMEN